MSLPALLQDLVVGRPLKDVTDKDARDAIALDLHELLLGEVLRQGVHIDRTARLRLESRRLGGDMALESQIARVKGLREHFENHGFPLRIFKGLANASSLYDDVRERPFSDVDVLVGIETNGLSALFESLDLHPRTAEAALSLWSSGAPVHELDGHWDGLLVDLHFNPYGMLAPLRDPDVIADAMQAEDVAEVGEMIVPSCELGLLIAVVNLAKNGGSAIWTAADIVRFVQGRAGPIDWERFNELAELDGLSSIGAQVLWAVHDDLSHEAEIGIPRPATRAPWAPTLGEDPMVAWSVRRHWSLLALRRTKGFRTESLRGLSRWYLRPPRVLSTLRPDLEGPYPLRLVRMQADRARSAWGRSQSG